MKRVVLLLSPETKKLEWIEPFQGCTEFAHHIKLCLLNQPLSIEDKYSKAGLPNLTQHAKLRRSQSRHVTCEPGHYMFCTGEGHLRLLAEGKSCQPFRGRGLQTKIIWFAIFSQVKYSLTSWWRNLPEAKGYFFFLQLSAFNLLPVLKNGCTLELLNFSLPPLQQVNVRPV